ncbi:glycoside hydrolase family 18 [Sulfobacillus acidophilus TPY]|uniref:Glycoside hydrolase family 18 n=1 Tax=Sulfobacillus acidophilus (strain ATCC 700253 / DSM 10332 / NAL) TaxID=679936 RepID=G8TWV7_SULAD|nr:glycoside hydrolase family 18 [Sulfobacillus acidophilus TPY]AEW03805.1 glycoside hydrolase family 18 [Sulfobacillus acidophilus DSM 10332]
MARPVETLKTESKRPKPGRWVIVMALALVMLTGAFSGGIHRITQWDRWLLRPAESGIAVSRPIRRMAPAPASGLPAGMVLGYFYDPGQTAGAFDMLRAYLPVLTGIIPFWYQINANGSLSGTTDPAVLQLAETHHLWTFALVENMAGQSVFGPLLASPTARRRAIDNMLTLVESNGYDGINLDWEGIAPSDRQAFSDFVEQLAIVFHRHGYYVTLSVPAETANQPTNSWTGAYDYRVLGHWADLLMVMAYDQHYAGGSPGPIASPGWVKQVLDYTISVVPPNKVILGIPGYGYDWSPSGPAVALTYQEAQALAKQYGASGSNHFVYVQNGQVHSVWFENTQSLLSKIQLVAGYELRGVALWRLGIEDPKVWNFLQ